MSQVACVPDSLLGGEEEAGGEWRSVKIARRMGREQRETFLFHPSIARASRGFIAHLRAHLTKAPATQAMPLVKSGHTVCDLSKCKTFALYCEC